MRLKSALKLLLLTALAIPLPAAGAENLTTLPGAVGFLDYHLRLKPDRFHTREVTLMWDVCDTAYTAAVFTVPAEVDADPLTATRANYRVVRRGSAAADTLVSSGTFLVRYSGDKRAGVSAVLRYRNGRAWLGLGGDKKDITVGVPFDAVNPGRIGYSSSTPMHELCNEILYFSTEGRPSSPVNSLQDVNEIISHSSDKLECYWKYFDRDTDPTLAQPGGFYTLATLSDGAGGYTIVYIDGDTTGKTMPFSVKGRMTPTIFPNHYDLVWYDVNGVSAADECSATVEMAGAMLRISIPLLKATMRFSRLELVP